MEIIVKTLFILVWTGFLLYLIIDYLLERNKIKRFLPFLIDFLIFEELTDLDSFNIENYNKITALLESLKEELSNMRQKNEGHLKKAQKKTDELETK